MWSRQRKREERFTVQMAQPGAAAAVAASMKEAARAFRWAKAFAAASARGGSAATQPQGRAKIVPVKPTEAAPQANRVDFSGRYTNLSLGHIWERYDFLQTHLLLQEALLLQQAQNPAILDVERELQARPLVEVSLHEAASSPLEDLTSDAPSPPRAAKGQ